MKNDPDSIRIVLRIRSQISHALSSEGYQIHVVEAPGRGWGGPFLPDGLDDSSMKAIRQFYHAYVGRQHTWDNMPIDERSITALRVAGDQLFRAFPETVQNRLHQAYALAQREGKVVEIILAFEPSAYPLLSLPWELLHNPDRRYFYALRGGGITRQLCLPANPGFEASFQPCILGVWAEPAGLEDLSTRRQYSPAPGSNDSIVWITGPDTIGQMEQYLSKGDFDSLHIVAHGRSGEAWHDFSLAFVAANGKPHWLSPDQLAVFLADYPNIRLVYLDICASTSNGERNEYTPGNLASLLIGAGISAVIAMQDHIAQDTAGLTAQNFYAELAQGATIYRAVTSARRAVRLRQDDPIQWSIPVLYVSSDSCNEQRFSIQQILRPTTFILLGAITFSGLLAYALAQFPPFDSAYSHQLLFLITISCLLPTWGSVAMRSGYTHLKNDFQLDRRGWLEILLHKYLSAAIWGMMWWFLIGAVWLFLTWTDWLQYLGFIGRWLVWSLNLSGLIVSGYLGARQAIHQKQIFLRIGPNEITFRDWLLLLFIPLLPALLLWWIGTIL